MCWIGNGQQLWYARVELFVDGDSSRFVGSAWNALYKMLGCPRGDTGRPGADQGTGMADRPVVGLVFWVRADDVAGAAQLAFDTATEALEGAPQGLYGVTIIPAGSAPAVRDSSFPPLSD